MGDHRIGAEFVQVAMYASGAPAFMAELRGVLNARRGCVVVGEGLVVFRDKDISWDGETLSYRGTQYRLGDNIGVMGGLMKLDGLTGLRLPVGWASTAKAFVVAPGAGQ